MFCILKPIQLIMSFHLINLNHTYTNQHCQYSDANQHQGLQQLQDFLSGNASLVIAYYLVFLMSMSV